MDRKISKVDKTSNESVKHMTTPHTKKQKNVFRLLQVSMS